MTEISPIYGRMWSCVPRIYLYLCEIILFQWVKPELYSYKYFPMTFRKTPLITWYCCLNIRLQRRKNLCLFEAGAVKLLWNLTASYCVSLKLLLICVALFKKTKKLQPTNQRKLTCNLEKAKFLILILPFLGYLKSYFFIRCLKCRLFFWKTHWGSDRNINNSYSLCTLLTSK